MIIIEKPEYQKDGNDVLLSSRFQIEGEHKTLWYRFSNKFENYLVTETLDASLVALLFLGLKTGNDIKLNGPVSARLLYTINHYLIKSLCLANNEFKEIKIFAENPHHTNLNFGKVAGTGMSCGVDSFATYFDHREETGPFKIEYFTFFNVGSHLDFGGEKARDIFKRRLKAVAAFAAEEEIELISVDSNLSEILRMNFQQTHSLRSISCVLCLQKLFKNYYYSSAYRFDHFKLNAADTSDSDIFNLSMLSTESTNLFASAMQFSRVERTLLVAKHQESFDKLDVCTDPPMDSSYLNCSICYKCLRTQFTLDIAGDLHKFSKVFDLQAYRKEKNKYFGRLINDRKPSPLDIEVLDFLKTRNFKPGLSIYYYSARSFFSFHLNSFKKSIKKKVL